MSSDFQSIGANPRGFWGRLAGRLMNSLHSRSYRKIIAQALREIKTTAPLRILDIGCGGGGAVRLFYTLAQNAQTDGIDISPDMVALAQRVNRKGIRRGQVDIAQGDVTALPYPDHSFDIVTAFDTINFWTDFDKAISEVCRALKKDGVFVIVNGYPKEGTKWWDFVKFKNSDAYRDMLMAYGFQNMRCTIRRNTIIIEANP